MAWTDDDEAREAIKGLCTALDMLTNAVVQSTDMHADFSDEIDKHIKRAREIAERIDAPRTKEG